MQDYNHKRGTHYCPQCNQIRYEMWINDGKCTRCNSPITFHEDLSDCYKLYNIYNKEMINELVKRGAILTTTPNTYTLTIPRDYEGQS